MIDKKDIEQYLGYEITNDYIIDYKRDVLVDINAVKKQSIGTITCNIKIQKSESVINIH